VKLERGLNATWSKGGLMYAIPFSDTRRPALLCFNGGLPVSCWDALRFVGQDGYLHPLV